MRYSAKEPGLRMFHHSLLAIESLGTVNRPEVQSFSPTKTNEDQKKGCSNPCCLTMALLLVHASIFPMSSGDTILK